MTDPRSQLRVLENAAGELERYLLSPEVFWRMTGAAELPSLTLGGLELARRALAAHGEQLDPEARKRARTVLAQIDQAQHKWRAAWERKAAAELKLRLNQWQAYLRDLAENSTESESYVQAVRTRAMVSYLLEESADQPELGELRKNLEALDAKLRASFEPGPFGWEPALQSAYPPEEYWFLYGRPKA